MIKYQIMKTEYGEFIIKNDVSTIPPVADNTDYQAYLAWLAEGNTPEEWNPDIINDGDE